MKSMPNGNRAMNEPFCLIDTDVLSYILKQREPYHQRICEYLEQHTRAVISL